MSNDAYEKRYSLWKNYILRYKILSKNRKYAIALIVNCFIISQLSVYEFSSFVSVIIFLFGRMIEAQIMA